MKHHEVYINVWDMRASIARYVEVYKGGFVCEHAVNSEALSDVAEAEVYAQGGAINMSGHYRISDELSEQAKWEE